MKLLIEVECPNIGPLGNVYHIVELIGGIASTAGGNRIRVRHAVVTNDDGTNPQSLVEDESEIDTIRKHPIFGPLFEIIGATARETPVRSLRPQLRRRR